MKKTKFNRNFICCNRCYSHFASSDKLIEHKKICLNIEVRPSNTTEKGKNDIVKFKDYNYMIMQSYNTEADFETYYDDSKLKSENKEGKSTILLGKIKPYSFAFQLNYLYNEEDNKVIRYTGKNTIDKFIRTLTNLISEVKNIRSSKTPLSNIVSADKNTINPICIKRNKIINIKNNAHKYRYYCKKTRVLLGFAYKKCSKNSEITNELTILMHNGSGFDFKLTNASISEYFEDPKFKILGKSTESISLISISNFNNTGITVRFIDSKKHLIEPLNNLLNSLSNGFNNKNHCDNKCEDFVIYYYRKNIDVISVTKK